MILVHSIFLTKRAYIHLIAVPRYSNYSAVSCLLCPGRWLPCKMNCRFGPWIFIKDESYFNSWLLWVITRDEYFVTELQCSRTMLLWRILLLSANVCEIYDFADRHAACSEVLSLTNLVFDRLQGFWEWQGYLWTLFVIVVTPFKFSGTTFSWLLWIEC